MNVVVIRGVLSSAPREQVLPSGSLLVSWEVSTRDDAGASTSVPVRWFDPPARLARVADGDDVVVVGSVRRRFYRAGGRTVSVTEVVGSTAAKASRVAEVGRMLAAASSRLSMPTAP